MGLSSIVVITYNWISVIYTYSVTESYLIYTMYNSDNVIYRTNKKLLWLWAITKTDTPNGFVENVDFTSVHKFVNVNFTQDEVDAMSPQQRSRM